MAVGTGASQDAQVVYRYLKLPPDQVPQPEFPERVVLAWRYKTDSGLPSPRERSAMDRLEDLMAQDPALGANARLVLVTTGDNVRTWTFYATSRDTFIAAFHAVSTALTDLLVEILSVPDPKWATYELFRRNVKQ